MDRRRWSRLVVVAAMALTGLSCTGDNANPTTTGPKGGSSSGDSATSSGSGSTTNPKETKKLQLAVIPKGTTHEFWKSVHAGALKAAAELGGVEIVWKGPNEENDTAGQIDVVKSMITRKVDGIVLAPNHSEALLDSVNEAIAAGIPTVIFDSGLAPGAEIVSYVATDNFHGGELAAEAMATALDGKGNVIMLRYKEGSESTEQREEGFLKKLGEYPDIKVLSSDQYAGTSTQSALEKAQQLLIKHRDEVNGIFAVCEPNCNGTLEALDQEQLAGKVKFVAFDPSDRLIAGLEENKVVGIVLQDPLNMGYQSVKALVAKIKGEAVEARIPTGEYVATPENMKTERYVELLHPKQAD